jgi:hypothetical protein
MFRRNKKALVATLACQPQPSRKAALHMTRAVNLAIEDIEKLARHLTMEEIEKLARYRLLEKDGVRFTLQPSVGGFVVGDTHAPCEKVEFRSEK